MIILSMQLSAKDNSTGEDVGDLHFSLFRGAHSILPRRNIEGVESDTQDYLICESSTRSSTVCVTA